VLCQRIEHEASWLVSKQHEQEEQEQLSDEATFFWTFLDQAVLIIERARLRARARSNNG
jgi:hypothetical protein